MRQIVLGAVVDGDAERTLTAAHSELATPAANNASMAAPTIDPAPGLTLLYGSQTGNTDGLEGTLASLDGERGMLPHRVSRADYRARDVGRERPLLRQPVADRDRLDAEARIAWALDQLPSALALSSSFGVQAAVMLHLMSRVVPGIPVIPIDTGYLFPETYRFIDDLVARLDLNLRVYRAKSSPAGQEARHGLLWEPGLQGIERDNRMLEELDLGPETLVRSSGERLQI